MGSISCTRKEFARGIQVPLDERTTIVVGPEAALATVVGRMFDAGKTFPLPRALEALRRSFGFVARFENAKAALVVGHVGEGVDGADTLSAERAEVVAAWLQSDPRKWVAQYDDSVAEEKRWGTREDRAMLRQIPDIAQPMSTPRAPSPNQASAAKPRDEAIRLYQTARGLADDGIAGPITREALVLDYFALSQRAIRHTADTKARAKLELEVSSHGAGDHFTLRDVEVARKQASEAPADDPAPGAGDATSAGSKPQSVSGGSNASRQQSRSPGAAAATSDNVARDRMDIFVFFADDGIQPPPSSPTGDEYLEWIRLATLHQEVSTSGEDGAVGTQLSIQVLDKHGTVAHANQSYTITGPEEFAGFTDSLGRIDIDDVAPGDYRLRLSLAFFEEEHQIVDEYEAGLVVLPGVSDPQVRKLGVVPRVVMGRLRGLLFDTNKAFLLPSALDELKNKIRPLYEANNPSELLVVGHTDTTADPSTNDPLSLQRAEATLAFLEDDVEVWLTFYESGVKQSSRWGEVEDEHMLEAVLSPTERAEAGANLLERYRTTRGIAETGPAGELTRTRLISEYMRLDGAELDSAAFRINGKLHGCGESFPLDDSGEELDAAPKNEEEDALDRRVELFFFDTEFGVAPAPAGDISKPDGTEYLTWRREAKLLVDAAPPALIRGDRFAVRLLDVRGKPMESTTEVAFSISVCGEQLAAGIAIDGWAIFRLPVDAGDLVDIVWGAAGDTVRFARRVDLSSVQPPEPGLSAARLGALGFPVREGEDNNRAAQAYQRTYKLPDADSSVVEHIDNVFTTTFEAPHPEDEAGEKPIDEEDQEIELPPDSGITEVPELS